MERCSRLTETCMNAPAISDADMVQIQLQKWIGKRNVLNVKISPPYSHPCVPEGDKVIAEVVDKSGQGLFFTDSGFTFPGRGFIHYTDVVAAHWMSSDPHLNKGKRKHELYDHIELSLSDGASITLSDLDKAVFPLLHSFEWMVRNRKHAS